MAASLTPAALTTDQYGIAQGARSGYEYEVYLTTSPGGIVKFQRKVATSTYETTTLNSAGFGDDALAAMVVGQLGLTGDLKSTTSSVETTHLKKPAWASTQSTSHSVGFAVAGSLPVSPATFDWGANGEIMYEVEIPGWDPAEATPFWFKVAGLETHNLVKPATGSKGIPEGLNGSRWTTRTRSKPGSFSLKTKVVGDVDGINAFIGLNTNVMIRVMAQGLLEVGRMYLLNWIPEGNQDNPDGDDQTTVSASGDYQIYAYIPAPGAT